MQGRIEGNEGRIWMKKTVLVFLMMLLAIGVFAQNGLLREVSGTVELKNAGAASFSPASVGDEVRQDTVISTGFKSTALVEVGSTLIAVRPLTRLTLTEIRSSSGAETLNVNLAAGRVRVDVNPPAGTRASMSVTSPSATASVRGTSFEFDLMNLIRYSGGIEYKGTGGYSFLVNIGTTSIGADGNPKDPVNAYLANIFPKSVIGAGDPVGNDVGDPVSTGESLKGTINVGLDYLN